MAKAKGSARKLKEGFVLDNSIVMAWSFEDETDEYADAVLDRLAITRAVVPALWPLEVANALLMGERRKRSTEADTIKWTGILESLPIVIDGETNAHAWSDTLGLRGHNLTAYDAAYLELAIRRGLPLATIDGKLRLAAETVGVALFDVSLIPALPAGRRTCLAGTPYREPRPTPGMTDLSLATEHDLPGRDQLQQIARTIATEPGELPDGDALTAVLDSAVGLTRVEAENAFSLSLIRHVRVAPGVMWELKAQTLKKSGLMSIHRSEPQPRAAD